MSDLCLSPAVRKRQVCMSDLRLSPAVRNETGVWFVFLPVAPLRSAAAVIPVLAAVTIALGLLSSVLLCHLLCFHVYLSKKQQTHLISFHIFTQQTRMLNRFKNPSVNVSL